MQKFYTLFLFILVGSVSVFGALTPSKVNVNGKNREYLTVTPESKNGSSNSLIVFLHGIGGSINECDSAFCYKEIAQEMADFTGSIVLLPQALDEQNPKIQQLSGMLSLIPDTPQLPVLSVWGAGMSISLDDIPMYDNVKSVISMMYPEIAAAGKIVLNKDVDDIAFINQIINDTKKSGNTIIENVFVIGVSMGGAMTYKYAYSENSQAGAIAVISGFVGKEVDNNKPLNIPACIFHSKDDEVVPYDGGMFNEPIPDIVGKIAQNCWATPPAFYDFPDITDDGITVRKATYPCGPELRFYTLAGAKHANFMKAGSNDIDYMTEVFGFFSETKLNSIKENAANQTVFFTPNPAKENIFFAISGGYELKTITGKTVLKGNVAVGERISVGNIPAGLYLITLKSVEGNFVGKLMIK